jgi:hypothetical protein
MRLYGVASSGKVTNEVFRKDIEHRQALESDDDFIVA